jgi:hypothetical protein
MARIDAEFGSRNKPAALDTPIDTCFNISQKPPNGQPIQLIPTGAINVPKTLCENLLHVIHESLIDALREGRARSRNSDKGVVKDIQIFESECVVLDRV